MRTDAVLSFSSRFKKLLTTSHSETLPTTGMSKRSQAKRKKKRASPTVAFGRARDSTSVVITDGGRVAALWVQSAAQCVPAKAPFESITFG
ncbi:unnamed protein product [Boreogadus saida]